jgi:hypothetical protein
MLSRTAQPGALTDKSYSAPSLGAFFEFPHREERPRRSRAWMLRVARRPTASHRFCPAAASSIGRRPIGLKTRACTWHRSPSPPSESFLLRTETAALFAPGPDGTDYLLWLRAGTLVAEEFDTGALKLRGEARAIAGPIPSIGGKRHDSGRRFRQWSVAL